MVGCRRRTCSLEKFKCGSREGCDLRTHAGVDNEPAATTFGNGKGTTVVPGMCRYETNVRGELGCANSFRRGQPKVVEKILSAMGVHGLTVAAIMEEMTDMKGSHNWRTVRLSFGTRGA